MMLVRGEEEWEDLCVDLVEWSILLVVGSGMCEGQVWRIRYGVAVVIG